MPRQLSFDLPARAAFGRDDFFVSAANEDAVSFIEEWRDWPARKLVLAGPEGSGKSHLAAIWAGLAEARVVAADGLAAQNIPELARGNLVVEDAEAILGRAAGERALFHLHNLVLAEGGSLLITASSATALGGAVLPDLASRLQGTPAVTLHEPDDALLMAVLMKLLADRQLSPTPGTLPYLAKRIERSFAAARRVIADLDRHALETGRPITRALAAEVLDKTGG